MARRGKRNGGFIPTLIKIARDRAMSGYLGDGANRWPAGHTLDVASLFRLALEKARPQAIRRPTRCPKPAPAQATAAVSGTPAEPSGPVRRAAR